MLSERMFGITALVTIALLGYMVYAKQAPITPAKPANVKPLSVYVFSNKCDVVHQCWIKKHGENTSDTYVYYVESGNNVEAMKFAKTLEIPEGALHMQVKFILVGRKLPNADPFMICYYDRNKDQWTYKRFTDSASGN